MALRGGPTEQCRSEGTPSLGEVPSGGAKAFCLLLRFSKVSRRQGGTLSSRNRRNGYTHRPNSQPAFVGMVGQRSDSKRTFRRGPAVAEWEEPWLTFPRRCQFSVRASRPENLVIHSLFGVPQCVTNLHHPQKRITLPLTPALTQKNSMKPPNAPSRCQVGGRFAAQREQAPSPHSKPRLNPAPTSSTDTASTETTTSIAAPPPCGSSGFPPTPGG